MLSSNFKLKIRSGESFLYRKEGTESQVFELRMRDKVSHFALQNACRKALKRAREYIVVDTHRGERGRALKLVSPFQLRCR